MRRSPRAGVVAVLVAGMLGVSSSAVVAQAPPDQPLPIRADVAAAADDAPNVRIHGSGWGHGVGMSQYGAYAQARAGWSVDDILGYYYPGTNIATDTRSSTQRIRVNIQEQVTSTTFRADADVAVRACGPEGGAPVSGRVAHDDCVDLATATAGTTYRVCPYGDRLEIVAATSAGEIADCASGPLHQTTRPVIRIRSDNTTLRTPPGFAGDATRRFTAGWRDLHRQVQGQPDPLPSRPVINAVQDVPSIETYLYGLAEVPSGWGVDGPAALEAQAVTGRTFAVGRSTHRAECSCQVRATTADQVYTGAEKALAPQGDRWVAAVTATTDRVLRFGDDLAQTFYSSSHGGRTENVEDSWAYGTTPIPYLRSVDDPWSLQAPNPRASWTAVAGNAQVAGFISAGSSPSLARVERLVVTSRTDGGTPRDIEVTGVTAAGERTTSTFSGRPTDAKPIAGNSIKLFLPILEGGQEWNQRVYSGQISRFSFGPFDDDDGSVHEFAISWAQLAGIVDGIEPTTFAPGQPVTRAQMATFLVNTFDIPAASIVGVFPDVPAANVHRAAIDAAAQIGLTDGFDDGTFRPGEPVTRQQMASFLARALAVSSETSGTFSDVRAANVHRPAIEALAERGVTQGCGDNRYCPGEPVLRGQLASFVHRVVTG
jgi:SpoIID/LytB domain protein